MFKPFLFTILLITSSVLSIKAQDTSAVIKKTVQVDSASLATKLEGTYVTTLPSNPGNFTTAKLIFASGVAKMFVDEMPIAMRECKFEKDSVFLKIEIEGESVSINLYPSENGIKGMALYEDMKIPFIAKKDSK